MGVGVWGSEFGGFGGSDSWCLGIRVDFSGTNLAVQNHEPIPRRSHEIQQSSERACSHLPL